MNSETVTRSHAPGVMIRGTHGTLQARALAGPYTASIIRHDAKTRLGRHAHGFANITLLLDGALRERSPAHDLTARTGTLFFRALAEPHANQYGPNGCRSLILDVPAALGEPPSAAAALYKSFHVERGGAASRLAGRIARELEQPDDCSALAIEGFLLELLATALRNRNGMRDRREHGPRYVERAIDYMQAHRTSAVTLATLAAVAGVSPNRLVRAFRNHVGVTPATCQRRMRAEWAAEELTRTDKAIAQIAVEAGFTDQSHLTRVFLRVFGVTPGVYRNRTTDI
jgi:AraC family transcriptional regulator